MIKLYGANASPFVRKVMAVLAIKQLPYEHIPSMPFSGDEELAKVSPTQQSTGADRRRPQQPETGWSLSRESS
jgi:hypothetical protein